MSVNINIITRMSNKTLEVIEISGNEQITTTTNNQFNLPYDNSYIIYIEPNITDISYTGFLDLSNTFLSGFYGYVWIVIFMLVVFYLFKLVKNYV